MDIMERSFALERGHIDLKTGMFPLRLFTNTGTASDGHVIHIPGLQVDDITPMFVNHDPDPVRRMGSMSNPRKVGKKTQLGKAALTFDGRIDVEGDGAMADIRRDIAHGISVGDITAMSGRWDPIKSVPRASLDPSHYAYSKIEGGWDTPMFFEKARVLEGSIVGVPADAAAMIGRSQDKTKPEHVRNFYDVLVHGDPLSRDRMLEQVFVDASQIERWEEIECEDGKVLVPASVARVWGQSTDDDVEDREEDGSYREKIERGLAERVSPLQSIEGDRDLDALLGGETESDLVEETQSQRQERLTAEELEDPDFDVKAWIQRDVEASAEKAGISKEDVLAYFRDNESTEPEPVSEPDSETTERAEPVSEPAPSATASAAVALLELPELPARADVIRDGIREGLKKWKTTELGYIE